MEKKHKERNLSSFGLNTASTTVYVAAAGEPEWSV